MSADERDERSVVEDLLTLYLLDPDNEVAADPEDAGGPSADWL